MKPAVITPADTVNPNDQVDDFVAQRHKVMLEKVQPENSESDHSSDEPELHERDVLNIEMSESDDDEEDSSSEDGDANTRDDREGKRGWGPKKNLWYGGDTHEYEIMEDEEREEALKDEEEEAIRLQNDALSKLRPEDYVDEDDDDTDPGEDDDDDQNDDALNALVHSNTASAEIAASALNQTAPEIPILIKEMLECRKHALIWKQRVHWNEVARILFHLYASLVNNVAFYLSLRTDPDSEGTDIRTHPVLVQIVRIRSLIKDARTLPCAEPVPDPPTGRTLPAPSRPTSATATCDEAPTNRATASDSPGQHANGKLKQHRESKKRKKRTKLSTAKRKVMRTIEEDEENVHALLPAKEIQHGKPDETEEFRQDQKRRKLNSLVNLMERDRKQTDDKRLASADIEVVRAETEPKKAGQYAVPQDQHHESSGMSVMEDDEEVMQKMLAKKATKEARKARKAAEATPHVYTFRDNVDPEARRRASSQVVKNRGLTRYRPKDKKTPRTKNRLAYSKAVVRRKGAVQDYAGKPGSIYSGEASGINMSARKGSRLSNV